MYNTLSQLALKLTAPGVPDFYQGTELWDLSLVDPDNRRPVDFGPRARLLAEMREQLAPPQPDARARLFADVLGSWEDGRIKLLLTNLFLLLRRDHPGLFGEGGYRALTPWGPRADKLVAFAREQGRELSITVAPRLVAGLLEGDARSARLPAEKFAGTLVPVPGLRPGDRVRDALTLELRTLRAGEQGAVLAADELFGALPVAVLIGEVPR
jgi:(1->4)-alpha-D-glucan 1-alpha-D-glucosylmutase